MAWRGRLNSRSRRRRRRGSRWSRRRRRYIERNGRTVKRIQLSQSALPRLLGFGRRRGHVLDLIILIGWKILIGGFTEEGVPVRTVEVWELGRIGHNSGKPVVERYTRG
jgi:hypothetical protein